MAPRPLPEILPRDRRGEVPVYPTRPYMPAAPNHELGDRRHAPAPRPEPEPALENAA